MWALARPDATAAYLFLVTGIFAAWGVFLLLVVPAACWSVWFALGVVEMAG
jgi:hypothetical protein